MPKNRFKQANKEAAITLAIYVFFFLWWTIFAFSLGSGDPADYTYILGMPAWFFYSCIMGYPIVTLLLWVVVRRFFADIPLDSNNENSKAKGGE
ncbi:YhdT family protein [Desulfovibrio sp. OttesenSCG-928-F07]|nr:YhdT family protein [Desulfovibrio sp. OttesenSCG-928-F07]